MKIYSEEELDTMSNEEIQSLIYGYAGLESQFNNQQMALKVSL